MTRGRSIAPAIVRRAKVRTALDDLAWDPAERLQRVVAVMLGAAARILRDAARFCRIGSVLRHVPVAGPFPDIADHVVDAVTIGRIGHHRRGPLEAVVAAVLERKVALPGVGSMYSARSELVAPGKLGTIQAAACGKFPLRFRRQVLAGPSGVGQ